MDKKELLPLLLETKLNNIDKIAYLKEMEFFGVLLPGLAHNLGSSITALQGYAQLIQSEYEELEEIDFILEETKMIESVIQNLMIRSRKYWDRKKEAINLNDIIRVELDFLTANLFYKHRVKKEIQLDENLPSLIGIYVELSQVVQQLLQNAVEAMISTPQKQLYVGTQYSENQIFLFMKDTGVGIQDEDMDHIFEWGFTTKKSEPLVVAEEPFHLGMGLPLVQQYVQAYDGNVQIQSSKTGTEVKVSFPVQID